ncbi:TIGR03086 family metal-binding protein [Mycobacterium sp. CVI_P3]|uniref:TIGR03086 family metal-binding protein n=1 Tax=Mycobacterium pinniadriaticum TaxID=2994102 RepID=A0ABT3SHE4_9MYCO|nr:TIGR03086 family metal-binding protein [Mycobacterium pinniadriaticum]MCX2932424.1 TIGR03086 family metal-binding protein [Mycobacterium pinniadriaticum]MCX2938942.1 TIGR03086 family metal-binding protein [Mycobacterium pinniadriaticum]
MDSLELLQSADRRLVDLTAGLGGNDLDLASPCSAWNVRSMLSHTVASIDAFAAAVDGGSGPTEQELFSGTDILGADPLGVVERSVQRSQRAWATITDWQLPVATVLGEMPAAQAIGIITYSTLVHSWDLAVAVGRPVEFDEAEANLAEAVGKNLVPPLRQQDLFGAEVETAIDATPTQRVVAFSGRSPL